MVRTSRLAFGPEDAENSVKPSCLDSPIYRFFSLHATGDTAILKAFR